MLAKRRSSLSVVAVLKAVLMVIMIFPGAVGIIP
jgi:hypothetical protein